MAKLQHYLREWRKASGLSQEKLAEAATELAGQFGVPEEQREPNSWGRTDVNKYENGKREPAMAFYRAAAAIFGCTIDDILSRRPVDPAPDPPDLRDVAPVWREVEKDKRPTALNVLKQFRNQ
jgi:transcriptional regulator with XRE-family HTH domain